MSKFDHWKNVCKLHWKEIVTLSIGLHWLIDLVVVIPLSGLIGYFLGGGFGH